MQPGSKLPTFRKKDTLREKLHTANNVIKQLEHELEVKGRCYQAVMKQRNEAEVKVKQLVTLIENDLWPEYKSKSELIESQLKKIGV